MRNADQIGEITAGFLIDDNYFFIETASTVLIISINKRVSGTMGGLRRDSELKCHRDSSAACIPRERHKNRDFTCVGNL